jgi:4-amino-4-deoxy-L-arabinose transferase-like glycosyltransferase
MDALTSPVRGNWRDKTAKWIAAHPKWTLTLAVVISLGPFLGKPFNMDDPLFVWTARQIHSHPWNPYGFVVNWYGSLAPMWGVTQNPPLAAYYLALAGGVLGWSEVALHVALLLPALAVILGTYRLARHFCDQPLPAALATLFTPVFLVSGTSVMCDVLMLAFWVWAAVLWVEGMEQDAFWPAAGAGLLIGLAALTKYFGACLIPLLAVYGVMSKRRLGLWAGCLLIPLLVLGGYEWATQALYGHDLLWKAAYYASRKSGFFTGARVTTGVIALSFTGGGLASVLFLAPWWLWRPRALLALVGGVALPAFALFSEGTLLQVYRWNQGWPRISMEGQIIFWTIGGVSVLALAVSDVWKRRDARSWLLALWVIGVFVFTAIFNWTINGRSILPMAPAVGILLARRWQPRGGGNEEAPAVGHRRIRIALAASALLAFLVAWSDFLLAAAAQQCALQTHERYGHGGRTIWFQGHWGFQYYLAELGGRAEDLRHPALGDGDVLAVPLNNTNLDPPSVPRVGFRVDGPRFLTDMNFFVGAGFYSSADGPLPFVFGHVPPENVAIFVGKSGPAGAP